MGEAKEEELGVGGWGEVVVGVWGGGELLLLLPETELHTD